MYFQSNKQNEANQMIRSTSSITSVEDLICFTRNKACSIKFILKFARTGNNMKVYDMT